MITTFHFLRVWWLLLIFPLLWLIVRLWKKNEPMKSWSLVCDKHLLDSMLVHSRSPQHYLSKLFLLLSSLLMIIGLAGPSWTQLPVPTYTPVQPKVFLLDLSHAMIESDISPNRLERAKFILRDIFKKYPLGQFALIAYTDEPFVVSPLTDDVQTIEALLSPLHPGIMPIGGQRLDRALNEAFQLIKQARFNHGQIVILTAHPPTPESIEIASALTKNNIVSSIMDLQTDKHDTSSFQAFAAAGQGKQLSFSEHSKDLLRLFSSSFKSNELERNQNNDIPLWRDEGRWFLFPALLFLLPVFRRGWIQRVF